MSHVTTDEETKVQSKFGIVQQASGLEVRMERDTPTCCLAVCYQCSINLAVSKDASFNIHVNNDVVRHYEKLVRQILTAKITAYLA